MKKPKLTHSVIIDCDTGVDDAAAILFAVLEPSIDIKLITTTYGNRPVDKTTRNTLHIMEKFNIDIPVSRGSEKPLYRRRKDASHIEGEEGLCNYIPTTPQVKKYILGEAVDNIYKTICEHPNEISFLCFGPLTNLAATILKYPDTAELLKEVIQVGGSPFRYKGRPPHVSFNLSSDPEAYDIMLKSGVKLTMILSEVGRKFAYFTQNQIMAMQDYNPVCDFVYQIYNGRWEGGYKDKRVSANDSCAVMLLADPKVFKTKKGFIEIDLEDVPGKADIDFKSKTPNITIVMKANHRRFHKKLSSTYKLYKDGVIYEK